MSNANPCFANILLQQAPIAHLTGSYANGRIAQTYLFVGSPSVGRYRTALAFAALLQCIQPIISTSATPDACGICDACRRITAGSHPDVHHITPEGYEIRIDQVRKLQEMASLKPNMGNWQVFIIDPADRLNVFSANALLKILEEAPSYVVFILIATDTSAVLPTILSRSEIIRFQNPTNQATREILATEFSLSVSDAAKVYAWSEGRFGSALTLAQDFSNDFHYPIGLRESHTAYLNELEYFSFNLQESFAMSGALDEALKQVAFLENKIFLPLQVARKEFCRSLIMSAQIPASFALLFTDLFLERVDQTKKRIKQIFDRLINDARAGYSSGMIKEIDGQINSALMVWGMRQLEEMLSCLLNWYADALRWCSSADETLLLNLDRKEDIITIAEANGSEVLRSKISLLEESVSLLRRYVQPSLVIENVITQIGGLEV